MQCDLSYLYQFDGSVCDADDVMIQDVFISINKQRIFPRRCNQDNGSR
jgi:hypothetical protein